MRSNSVCDGSRIVFSFEKDGDDEERCKGLNFTMGEVSVFVDLNGHCPPRGIHPDLIAVATILLCNPFVGKRLELPLPVSEGFIQKAGSVISRYRIEAEVDSDLPPLEHDDDFRPALSFSGGADSAAALSVMPGSTIPIFLNRPLREGSLYNSDAPLTVCQRLRECGYNPIIIDSDLEYIRDPVGFPTDLAHSIPSILLSRSLGINSISFGTIMESGFGIGHEHYVDYQNGAHWRFYNTLFNSVGIELSLPTIGISEVGTAIIGNISPIAAQGQSCIRGSWREPCLKCWKCFRKELLGYSLGHSEDSDFLKMMEVNEIRIRLSSFPISHENVIVYSLQRIELDAHPHLRPIADKLDMGLDLTLLERWYPPSIDFVPDGHRYRIRENILGFLGPMSASQEIFLRNWDMDPHLESERTRKAQERLKSLW